MKKFSFEDSFEILKKLFPVVDEIASSKSKKDRETLEILNMLQAFKNDFSKIYQKKGLSLEKITKNPLSLNLYFKLAVSDDTNNYLNGLESFLSIDSNSNFHQSYRLKDKIKKIQNLKVLIEKKEPSKIKYLLAEGKSLLTLLQSLPNKPILQEGCRILRDSKYFSQCLFNNILNSPNFQDPNNKILTDIETLLEQNPNTLADLDLTHILTTAVSKEAKNCFETFPLIGRVFIKKKMEEIVNSTEFSPINVDNMSKLISDKLMSEDCSQLKICFIKNNQMIFVDINKQTGAINLSNKPYKAKGIVVRVFSFQDEKIIKIPIYATLENLALTENGYSISERIYNQNPEEI
ncbi:MAG: hypothetical protein JSS09_08530, partial [Verrucomicrobia bacterium]|nr:hypothetical protein [Verrucomicrobiota bacterium]